MDYLVAEDNSEPGLALEFLNTLGDTIDVLFVPESSVEPLHEGEVWHGWELVEAVR